MNKNWPRPYHQKPCSCKGNKVCENCKEEIKHEEMAHDGMEALSQSDGEAE